MRLVATRITLDHRLELTRQDIARRYLRGDKGGIQEAAELGTELEAIESALA
jgi:hypothetical protein